MPTQSRSKNRAGKRKSGSINHAQYQQRGEIVPQQSPLYAVLDPIGNAIAIVADREYYTPFHFILVNERMPNAMSIPDGNVYVTTGMLSFLKNRDQLAGVLCHEINHDIHHDMYHAYQISPNAAPPTDFTRAAESNADRAGAYTCAQAGFNPWGMVWKIPRARRNGRPASRERGRRPSERRTAPCRPRDAAPGDPATFGKFRDDVELFGSARDPRTNVTANALRPTRIPYAISATGLSATGLSATRLSATRLSAGAVSAAAAAISRERRAVPAAPAAAVLSRVLTLAREGALRYTHGLQRLAAGDGTIENREM